MNVDYLNTLHKLKLRTGNKTLLSQLIYAAKIFNRKRFVYCAGFDLLYLDINANKLYLFEFCILRSFHLVRCHGLKSKSAVVLTSRNGLWSATRAESSRFITWDHYRDLQSTTNYFLMSLALADLLVCTVVMPFGALSFIVGKNLAKEDLVILNRFSSKMKWKFYLSPQR